LSAADIEFWVSGTLRPPLPHPQDRPSTEPTDVNQITQPGENVVLYAVLTLVAAQYLGDLMVDTLSLPVPGVVVGLLLLCSVLAFRGRWLGREEAIPAALNNVAKGLHDHLGLLFVPAGAGVVADADRLVTEGPALIAVLLLSTGAAIAVTSLIVAQRGGAVAADGTAAVEQRGA
jgi:putative effector of murein hydrolase LrgA (UPF0299 family)